MVYGGLYGNRSVSGEVELVSLDPLNHPVPECLSLDSERALFQGAGAMTYTGM